MARMDDYGVDISAPADANDSFSNASVQGGDNRNDSEIEKRLNIVRNDQGQVTNPYGDQGFFSRVLGIDASSISYNNLLGQGTLEGIARLNVDRYNNPYASTNVLNAPVGGNQTAGTLRSGVSAGDPTRFGEVRAQREPMTGTEMTARGLASLFGGPMMGATLMSMRDDPVAIKDSQFYDPKLDPESELYEGSGMLGSLMAPLTGGVTASDVSSYVSPMMERVRDMFSTGSDISNPNLSVDIGAAGLGVDPMTNLPAFGDANLGRGRDKEARTYNPVQELRDKYSGTMNATSTDVQKIQEEINRRNKIRNDAILKGASPAEATLVSDLSIGDLLKRGVDSATDFLNIPNTDNFNPKEPSISPYLKSPDLDGRGGNTMGVNFKFPFYG